jgi:hypothetical protein
MSLDLKTEDYQKAGKKKSGPLPSTSSTPYLEKKNDLNILIQILILSYLSYLFTGPLLAIH